jgi:hypothetical protein
VVALGVTDLEVAPVTLMLPGSSLKPVAPLTDHDKTEDCPLVIELGEAVNDEITGSGGGGVPFVTVTVTLRVALPALFVAVKV